MRQAYRVNSKKANWPKFIFSYLSVLSESLNYFCPLLSSPFCPVVLGLHGSPYKKNYFTCGKKFKTLTGIKLPLRPHLSNNSRNQEVLNCPGSCLDLSEKIIKAKIIRSCLKESQELPNYLHHLAIFSLITPPLFSSIGSSNYHSLVVPTNTDAFFSHIPGNPEGQDLLPGEFCLCNCVPQGQVSILLLQQLLAFRFSCGQLLSSE